MITPTLSTLVLLTPLGVAPLAGAGQPVKDPLAPAAPRLSWVDLDADGRLEVFVASPAGQDQLYRNEEGRFLEVTEGAGLLGSQGSHGALWIDVERDGDLDLLTWSPIRPTQLWSNDGRGYFADVTADAGLASETRDLNVTALDYDGDGQLDLQRSTALGDRLFRNVGKGRFAEIDLAQLLAPTVTQTATGRRAPGTPPLAGSGGGSQAAGAGSSGGVTVTPLGNQAPASPQLGCAASVEDMANPGTCAPLSTVPTLGSLYPLGLDFNIDGLGNVGIGTLSPADKLDVNGTAVVRGQLISTESVAAPFLVSSSAKVDLLNADLLDGLDSAQFSQLGQSIEGTEILDGSVKAPDLADGSVTSSKILDGAVSAADIGTGQVGTAEILDNTILAIDIAAGAVGSSEIATNAVNSAEIATGAVGSAEIATDAVGAAEIATGAVGASEIATSAVGAAEIALNAVGASEIAAGAVGSSEIATGAVDSAELAPKAVLADKIDANAVNLVHMNDNSVGSAEIIDGSVDSADIATNSVGTSEIDNYAVEWANLASPMSSGTSGAILWAQNTGQGKGLYVTTDSSNNPAVDALALNTGSGVTYGVKALSASRYGFGVWGRTNGIDGTGVKGEALAANAIGLRGENLGTTGLAVGVQGETSSTSGRAIYGRMEATSGSGQGVRGWTNSASGYGVYSSGDFGGTGAKYFIQPHPLDASKQINFVCLEGNESGTYFRGTGHVLDGRAVIEVPEDFRLVTDSEGLTVQLTVVGSPAAAWVESQDLERIVVRATGDVTFHYMVNGVRRGFTQLETIRENSSFVPTVRDLPYGNQYPEELRRILVENGTLNADFTPNLAKAAELGWILEDRVEDSTPE